MHELDPTRRLLEIALEKARSEHASRVTDLHLVIGERSTVSEESVRFYFDNLALGTPCEGAALHFTREPSRLVCRDCGAEIAGKAAGKAAIARLVCPSCGGERLDAGWGSELRLESIEVERIAADS